MKSGTEEARINRQPTALLDKTPFSGEHSRGVASLMVRECVPAMASAGHEAPLRTAYISTANEALALPWIAKLPGQKRIQFVHGQIFVMQHYLGWRVIRAHICQYLPT
jgi:hypothetical protein